MTKHSKEIIFFILAFLLFCLATKTSHLWNKHTRMGQDMTMCIMGIVYTLVLVAIFYLAKMNNDSSENFWDIDPVSQCAGGPYTWQGDDPASRYCKKLYETPQGRCDISSWKCGKAYVGRPGLPFYYTPLSNDKWQNERCMNKEKCPCDDPDDDIYGETNQIGFNGCSG